MKNHFLCLKALDGASPNMALKVSETISMRNLEHAEKVVEIFTKKSALMTPTLRKL